MLARPIAGTLNIEPLRTQSLKGVIRWWTRAFLAGALYRLGYRDGRLLSLLARLSGRVWGSSESASPFIIRVLEGRAGVRVCPHDLWHRLAAEHQRVRLLLLGRRRISPGDLCGIAEADVILYRRLGVITSETLRDFAAFSMIASLVLGCLGKASRRGLGCFDAMGVSLQPQLRRLLENLPSSLPELIAYGVGLAEAVVREKVAELQHGGTGEWGLPPVAAIAPGYYRVYLCRLDGIDPLLASIKFSKCVTAQYRRLGGRDPLDGLAWVLGLPRSQRGRGYLVRTDNGRLDVGRRASPIVFTVHRGYALLQAFYSADWPQHLIHVKSYSRRSIYVTERVIRDTVDTAIEHLVVCLDSYGRLGPSIRCKEVSWRV
jgi:CRISPR-associated protein Cmr1